MRAALDDLGSPDSGVAAAPSMDSTSASRGDAGDRSRERSRADVPASATVGDGASPLNAMAPRGSGASTVLGRVAYWMPVLAALVLFAQVSFLGLRPAMREAGRLADAAVDLEARHAEDRALYAAHEVQLAARRDPIFRERQDRLRRARPVPGATSGT